MIARLKKMMAGFGSEEKVSLQKDELQLATAALLVEAAVLDGSFDNEERQVIKEILTERFSLSVTEADDLIGEAEAVIDQSSQIYNFTRIIKDKTPHEERVDIVEMLWEVAYADGELHDYEANLVRRVSGLINVADRDSGIAKQRAMQRLGLK
ncbi:MAG: TerB family tellurite resistance protein [Rhodospirillales bacterium]|nr:TerB family tellurite resistance protein [Rhodospirillales bacterium]